MIKATGKKYHLRREAMWTANSKATETGLLSQFRAHILIPCDLDPGHKATGIVFALMGLVLLRSNHSLIFSHSPLLDWECLCHCILEICRLLFVAKIPSGRCRHLATTPSLVPTTEVQFLQTVVLGNQRVYWTYLQSNG